MSRKKKNIDKLHEIIGGEKERFTDNSSSWVSIENDKYAINFSFDGSGEVLNDITVFKKIYEVVDEKKITTFKS